jgi:hypothetical protein
MGLARHLPEGAYEHPITQELEAALRAIYGNRRVLGAIADDESAVAIARHVAREIARVLEGSASKDRAEAARWIPLQG